MVGEPGTLLMVVPDESTAYAVDKPAALLLLRRT
jgi:hypothetical protein